MKKNHPDPRHAGRSALVCGGAGYIGSHMCRVLAELGWYVEVLDNLSTGDSGSVKDYKVHNVDLLDEEAVKHVLKSVRFDAVFHFAAFSLVGESMREPSKYFSNNVGGTLSLLEAMAHAGVKPLIFSSTAAVYGSGSTTAIPETAPCLPSNPYGASKLVCENIIASYVSLGLINAVGLRYFNAAGAHPDKSLVEHHNPETHLIPLLLTSINGTRGVANIYGNDYPTEDGTCVRDYVHVMDLCRAHALAYDYLLTIEPNQFELFNLGSGVGYSVEEVIQSCERVTGAKFVRNVTPRRAGDPPILVADVAKAGSLLGWFSSHTLDDVVHDAAASFGISVRVL